MCGLLTLKLQGQQINYFFFKLKVKTNCVNNSTRPLTRTVHCNLFYMRVLEIIPFSWSAVISVLGILEKYR